MDTDTTHGTRTPPGAESPALVIGDGGRARPAWAAADPLLRAYYDEEWGVPVTDEAGVFERLVLEAFQAGLSWRTVLAKRPRFREAFLIFEYYSSLVVFLAAAFLGAVFSTMDSVSIFSSFIAEAFFSTAEILSTFTVVKS